MTEFRSAGRTCKAALIKVSRESIATMRVEANDCPQVLKIVLGLIAEHQRVPFSIRAQRSASEKHICVEIDELSDRGAKALLGKVTAIVSVKRATWTTYTNAQPSPTT